MRWSMVSLLCLSVVLLVAADNDPLDPAKTRAVLRIDDIRWLEREAVRMAAAQGRDPAPLRRSLAQTLFRCRSLAGIDTSRPALLAWRNGKTPLVAIIPVADRRQLIDDFGAVPAGEPPLVRVADRDGAVVFSQNHADGVREYRLLVAGGTAYLAHSLEECRALAARPLTAAPAGEAPISLWSRSLFAGADLDWSGVLDTPLTLPATTWLNLQPVQAALRELAARQGEWWRWELRPAGEGELSLSLRAQMRADSALAQWLAAQRNQASRLAPLLRGERTALMVWGSLGWSGQLAEFGASLSTTMRNRLGPAWIPQVDEAWRTWWSLWERTGDCAWGLEIATPDQYLTTTVVEIPRAAEQAAAWEAVAGACTGIPGTGGNGAYQRSGRVGNARFAQSILAVERHVVAVDAFGGLESEPAAKALAARLPQAVTLEGEPALISLWCDVARLARASPAIPADANLVPAVITASLRQSGAQQILLEATIPLRAIAAVLSQAQPVRRK